MGGTFSADLSRFCKKYDADIKLVIRKIAFEAFKRVILRSPVGNPDLWKRPPPEGYVGGRFRANWGVAVGSPWNKTVETVDKEGTATISKAQAGALQWNCQGSIFLTNHLPYAIPLEYGHSGVQAPQGMVRVTMEEITDWVKTVSVK